MSVNPSFHTESRLEKQTLKLQWDPSEWNFVISLVEPKAAEHLGVGNVDALNLFLTPLPSRVFRPLNLHLNAKSPSRPQQTPPSLPPSHFPAAVFPQSEKLKGELSFYNKALDELPSDSHETQLNRTVKVCWKLIWPPITAACSLTNAPRPPALTCPGSVCVCLLAR